MFKYRYICYFKPQNACTTMLPQCLQHFLRAVTVSEVGKSRGKNVEEEGMGGRRGERWKCEPPLQNGGEGHTYFELQTSKGSSHAQLGVN